MNTTAHPPLSSPDSSPPEPLSRRQEGLLVGLLSLVPTLVKLVCYPSYPGSDDAFIHLTIVRNVVHGLGWGINPGEPINLSSSPLYTILVALLNLCGCDALTAGSCLSALVGLGALLALHRLLATLGVRQAGRVAGVAFAAFNIYLWRWGGVVMETTLSVFLLTLAYWAYHRADTAQRSPAWRYLLTGVLAGLAMLTRFELALVMGCFGLRELAVHRKPAHWLRTCTLMGLGFLVTIVPWFLFCRSYFHLLLPTTFYAKTSHGLIWWNPAVASEILKVVASSEGIPLLVVGLLLAVTLARRRTGGFGATVVERLDVYLFPLALALFYYLKTPALQSAARYYLPGLQILAAALACAFDSLEVNLPARWTRSVVVAVVALHAALSLGFNQVRVAPILSRFHDNYLRVAQEAAVFLKTRATGDRKLNVLVEVDIGMLSFFAGDTCYFIDGGALATPSLMNVSIPDQVSRTHPDLVAETLGGEVGGLRREVPALELIWSRQFLSHSVTAPDSRFVYNIYENKK